MLHLIFGYTGKLTSIDPETRAKGLSKLIFGIVIIYLIYTFIRTQSIQPIFVAIGLCIVWGAVSMLIYFAYKFWAIFCCESNKPVNIRQCRGVKTKPFGNINISDIILLFISFSLLIFSIRQMGRLFEYQTHRTYLSTIESLKIKEWLEGDWIIFKVLIVLYITLLARDITNDIGDREDPVSKLSYVFFLYHVLLHLFSILSEINI